MKAIVPLFDQAKCNGCGLCVEVCLCGALVLKGDIISVVRVENCGLCGDCELVCETGALQCPYEIVCEEDSTKSSKD